MGCLLSILILSLELLVSRMLGTYPEVESVPSAVPLANAIFALLMGGVRGQLERLPILYPLVSTVWTLLAPRVPCAVIISSGNLRLTTTNSP